jgi:hypothetical protein
MCYVHAEILDRKVENYLFHLTFLSTSLSDWADTDKVKLQVSETREVLSKLRKRIEGNERKWGKLLDKELEEKYPDSVIEDERERLQNELDSLKDERERLEQKLSDLGQRKARGVVLADNVDALRELVGRIDNKFDDMSFEDKRVLLQLFVPDGCFVDVYPVERIGWKDGKTVKYAKPRKEVHPVTGSRVLVKWMFVIDCSFDTKRVIAALKEYDETGKIDPVCLNTVYKMQRPDEQPPDQKVLSRGS